jgi:hypothetical protein
LVKPTLDALKGVAYSDDHQVRSITASLFDLTQQNIIDGRVEHMGKLFYSANSNVLLIAIYSDIRLKELGGEEEVKKRRFKDWNHEFEVNFQRQP